MAETDTIVALSSGALPAGVAVLRASGPQARTLVERLAGRVPEGRRASLRTLRDGDGATIDRGLVLFFAGPATVTGEDLAEFHLHGGRAVVAAFMAAATEVAGVRSAEAGEFTRRGFENGRFDLTEAEGLADLIAAETEGQRRAAVSAAGGALAALYTGWADRLTASRARLEAGFDFSDEGDVADDQVAAVDAQVETLIAEMDAHLAGAHRGEILREGYKVAIVGAPNAGKSSLLNALVDREAAIVTDVPGTTRDVIEATLDLHGVPVRLSDTAGIRETADAVEAIGVERARRAMNEADLVLALVDPHEGPGPLARLAGFMSHVKHPLILAAGSATIDEVAETMRRPRHNILTVRTKADRGDPQPSRLAHWLGREGEPMVYDLAISTRTGDGIAALIERIAGEARTALGDPTDAIPARERHRELVAETLGILRTYREERDAPAELRAETLRQAGDRLGALTGRVGVEDLLDVIFSEFCIGK